METNNYTLGKRMWTEDMLRKMEKSTVGTFTPLWNEYCKMTGCNDPKQFERELDKMKKRD